ncbi:MAG: ATP-binding protein [Magnetovibrionaceae bacterium]
MRGIGSDDVLKRLAFDNPWWELKPDTEIRFRHPPKRFCYASFAAEVHKRLTRQALVLVGPRRAGKTVMMRQMVAELIEGGLRPTAVLFAALTTPSYTATGLKPLFETFRKHHGHRPGERLYVFLDEAQYVGGWEEQVKALAHEYPQTRFITAVSAGGPGLVTGDQSDDGKLVVQAVPPLTFMEFLRFRGSEEKLFGTGTKPVFKERAIGALNAEFARYINFGSFPEGILLKNEAAPAPTFIRDHLTDRVLHKDMAGLFGVASIHDVNRLFAVLVANTSAEVSIEELARESGIAKNTLRKYMEYLESAFLVRRVMRIDRDGKPYQRAVSFKAALTAPCFQSALFGPAGVDDEGFERLVETAITAQWLAAPAARDLAYAGWRGGGVDLVALDPTTAKPDLVIEMDWQDTYARAPKGPENLAQFALGTNPKAKAVILTRTLARPGTIKGIDVQLLPASLYAYFLVRDRIDRREAAITDKGGRKGPKKAA